MVLGLDLVWFAEKPEFFFFGTWWLRIAYPAGRNRWQVEFHIRLQPNAEKQNWAHRLYDHARAREGTDEGILLEVAGPMSTLGTFGQEELLRDVHRVIFVAIGVGFTGCIHPLFHAHEAHIRPEHIRFCCRTPSAEYGDALEPVCSAYGLRRGNELRISVSDGPAKEGENQTRSQWNEMLTAEVSGIFRDFQNFRQFFHVFPTATRFVVSLGFPFISSCAVLKNALATRSMRCLLVAMDSSCCFAVDLPLQCKVCRTCSWTTCE